MLFKLNLKEVKLKAKKDHSNLWSDLICGLYMYEYEQPMNGVGLFLNLYKMIAIKPPLNLH